MSKRAEQAAERAYPHIKLPNGVTVCMSAQQVAYKEGYEKAEKDFTLNWGDVQLLDSIVLELVREEKEGKDWGDGEKFYTEVLNRFNKSKEEV